ncbi:predicted pyrophosphatase [Zymobacter palmae]|uniref:Predicted pyrophosphatase n=2 Tax=Zymobacter group TaxID=114403 RepID=A0A348HHW7_9GAMM|nr:predicted pyrophosphatase [Zymobacter palmae]
MGHTMKTNALCKGLALTALLSMAPLAQAAENWFLPQGSLACLTPESFEVQRKLVTQNKHEIAEDCGTTKERFIVNILQYSFFSGSHVKVLENGVELWVFSSTLDK